MNATATSTAGKSDTILKMKRLRRFYYGNVVLEFAALGVLGMAWFSFSASADNLWWFILLASPIFILHQRYLNNKMQCPKCQKSLVDWDGIALHAKRCPHCDTILK